MLVVTVDFETTTPALSRRCSASELRDKFVYLVPRASIRTGMGLRRRQVHYPVVLTRRRLESTPGVEPGWAALQAAAWPLGYVDEFLGCRPRDCVVHGVTAQGFYLCRFLTA